jgi:hypothetical protein
MRKASNNANAPSKKSAKITFLFQNLSSNMRVFELSHVFRDKFFCVLPSFPQLALPAETATPQFIAYTTHGYTRLKFIQA